MLLLLLAMLDTIPMFKTEVQEVLEVFNGDTFKIATFELWEGEIEWDAEQGDSLITSPIPLGVYDYYRLDFDGISEMILGWYIDNSKLPLNEWEVEVLNTGSKNKINRAVRIWDKQKVIFGFRARSTKLRTVKISVTRVRIGG